MQSAISIADVMGKALEEVRYNDASSHSPRSIAYGLTRLDEVTGGLDPGELVVVGGRPSMGKTAFLLNLIRNTALAQKKGVVYYSSELSAENICRILLMNETGLYTNPFRENILSEYEWATMEKSAEGFSSAPVFIDDTLAFQWLNCQIM